MADANAGPYRTPGALVGAPGPSGICVEVCGDCGAVLRSYRDIRSSQIGKPGPCVHCKFIVVGAELPPLASSTAALAEAKV